MDKPDWAVRKPRSSRICYRCEHKYASHIQEGCLKIIQRRPIRLDCTCTAFVADKDDMQIIIDSLNRRIEKLIDDIDITVNGEPKNTLKGVNPKWKM